MICPCERKRFFLVRGFSKRFIQRSHVGHLYPLPFPSIPLFSPLTCKIINACMPFHLSPFAPYMLYQIRTSVPTSHLSLTTFNDSIINYAYSLEYNSHYHILYFSQISHFEYLVFIQNSYIVQ